MNKYLYTGALINFKEGEKRELSKSLENGKEN